MWATNINLNTMGINLLLKQPPQFFREAAHNNLEPGRRIKPPGAFARSATDVGQDLVRAG